MKVTEIAPNTTSLTSQIAAFAVDSLLEELNLTPKPGLVDQANSGCHLDLNMELMTASAKSLYSSFHYMALAAQEKKPSQSLREQLAAIGRLGEQEMLMATGNVNTHKGAIWCIGLLTAAVVGHAQSGKEFTVGDILDTAGMIASFDDRYAPPNNTNGDRVRHRYAVVSAREEAMMGFPSLKNTAIPAWVKYAREHEDIRQLNVLLSLMAVVDDTCILHRSDIHVAKMIKKRCCMIMDSGGLGRVNNWPYFRELEKYITKHWVSPGGSADLLAATIFIHKITKHFKIN